MDNYEKIENGICIECDKKLRPSEVNENNGLNKYCDKCGLKYIFNTEEDSFGTYSISNWKSDMNIESMKKEFTASLKDNIKKLISLFRIGGHFPVDKIQIARLSDNDLRILLWARTSDLPYIQDIEADTLRTFRFKDGERYYE